VRRQGYEEEARMADSDQILQLGIDEARNGNREAARNLFELLTRQEPGNAQGWLWLAGVADGTDQRREALQHVLALDPENEMARKGLQAMGVATPTADVVSTAPTVAAPAVSEPVRVRSNDEAFADELDMAFDDDYSSIPRAEAPPRELEAEVGASGSSGSSTDTARRDTSRRDSTRRDSATSADRPTLRRPSPRVRTPDPMGDDEPVRRGPSPLLWALAALIGIVLIIFIALNFFRGPDDTTANKPTSVTSGQVTPGITEPTSSTGGAANPTQTGDQITQPTADPALQPTADPALQPTADPALQPTAVPAPPQPTVIPAEAANPAPVGVGTVLQADGWNYTYPQANYAVVLGKQVNGQTAQGNFVHVLGWIANGTGKDQVLPADFFVLKDAQGRVYNALPSVSSALVARGATADIGLEDNVPANGVTTSVYLVFDVPSGATNLVLFARTNPTQGFKVLDLVP
jgi:hypothetical protein